MSDISAKMETTDVSIECSWKNLLNEEFNSPYFERLVAFVKSEKAVSTVFPPGPKIFAAFNHTPVQEVKVVVIGQDPYHGPNQANGFCFSVSTGIKPPPSLRNIFKELTDDVGFQAPGHGDLEAWADQGVLMINATLTVRAGEAGSHQKQGWEEFTDAVIQRISRERTGLVFLLWGKFAQNKASLIADNDHLILQAAHPSPFAAHNGFFGCKHFSKVNAFLSKQGKQQINWQI